MRLAVLALSLLTANAADKLTLGKPAPQLAETKARTLFVFEPLDSSAEQQLKAIGITVNLTPNEAVAQAYGAGRGQRVAVLVDEQGILRRVIKRKHDDSAQFAATAVREMRAWEEGKAIYEGQCARCHGEDGNGSNYPNIKMLGGIGNRLTEPEIAERTGQVGTVDLTVLGERVKSLAAYVAGL